MWGNCCGSGNIVGFNIDRGTELTTINADIDVQKSDMGGESVPSKVDGIAT